MLKEVGLYGEIDKVKGVLRSVQRGKGQLCRAGGCYEAWQFF